MRGDLSRNSCSDLAVLSKKDFQQWLDSFDTVLCDCDGVLWNQMQPLAGGTETLNAFRRLGKRVILLTNNATRTRREILLKSQKFGHNVDEQDIVTASSSAAAYLHKRQFTGKAYVIGRPSIGLELDAVGIRHCGIGPDTLSVSLGELVDVQHRDDPEIQAVIVSFDEHFSFPKLFRAASYLERSDCLFIGTNRDERVRMADGRSYPEAGPMLSSVETVAGRKCVLVGKPSPVICEELGLRTAPGRTLMIGDRHDTDVALGLQCGYRTLMVCATGVHTLEHALRLDADRRPDFVVDRMDVVWNMLKNYCVNDA